MDNDLVRAVNENHARVNVTYAGSNGDLPDPVNFDAPDEDVKRWVTEAVRGGGIPGIRADAGADFTDFVVDRFRANEARPYNMIQIRPKTPFGFWSNCCSGCGRATISKWGEWK